MHKSIFIGSPTEEVLTGLKRFDVDSVMVDFGGLNGESVDKLRKAGGKDLEIYAHVSSFAWKDLREKFPDSVPVEASGKEVPKDRVCPTHEGVRKYFLEKVEKVLKLDINGVWVDSLRYPTKWEVPEPEILDTCYCDRCIKLFEEYIGEPIEGVGGEGTELENLALHIDGSYYHEWLEFKSLQLETLLKDTREVLKKTKKDAKLGYYAVPWQDKDHGAAITRIVGQDFGKLSKIVDITSPMLYHKMVGKNVEWIKEMVDYFWNLGAPFLPLVQVENIPDKLPVEEFVKALEYGATKPSMGVCIFYLDRLVEDTKKLNAAVKFFEKSMS